MLSPGLRPGVDTRPPRRHAPVLPGHPPDSGTTSAHELRNPGRPILLDGPLLTARLPDRRAGPARADAARLAGRAVRALRPPRRVERADREPQPENQEHQADRPRLPQLRPLPTAVVAQPRPHPRGSHTDANQNPRSQVGCVEPDKLNSYTSYYDKPQWPVSVARRRRRHKCVK